MALRWFVDKAGVSLFEVFVAHSGISTRSRHIPLHSASTDRTSPYVLSPDPTMHPSGSTDHQYTNPALVTKQPVPIGGYVTRRMAGIKRSEDNDDVLNFKYPRLSENVVSNTCFECSANGHELPHSTIHLL